METQRLPGGCETATNPQPLFFVRPSLLYSLPRYLNSGRLHNRFPPSPDGFSLQLNLPVFTSSNNHYANTMSLRLDALPAEILFNILSFSEPTCDPKLVSSPLCTMAATNRYLNAIVEDYCRSLLVQHTDSKGRKAMKNTWRRKWLAQTCQYCKKKTARKATLYKALTCCQSCDWKEFPKKVRRSNYASWRKHETNLHRC